jgi:predicted acylesterase/phospholipase RssA
MHKRLGFCGELISVKSCSTPDELANLVLASSCTPPITPWYSIGGRPALDGGLVESIPLSGIPMRQARTLVLLTGARADLPTLEQTVFVSPASDAGIASWNYTDAGAIDRLYDRGARDAEMFIAKLSNGSIAKGSLPAEFPVCTTAPRAATGGR